MMIEDSVEKLLKDYGFEIECHHPFEICYTETGDRATGVAADFVVEAILEQKRKDDEHTRRLDAFGRL